MTVPGGTTDPGSTNARSLIIVNFPCITPREKEDQQRQLLA